ncbi:flavin reductase [Arthrobacter sp. Soil782]|uniref:flavin reductase family protein n=1 Tax=Arthrobacter sp. Soil782 TaxID=1736410 RepID=UPI0006F96826|nr:flavin reductase family protein [Arthrobacter sp. Soil782]KRF08773.1 flavin reductase [Arthrobacter sp. Soil782]
MRRDFYRDQHSAAAFYKLLTATVVPRPIAWVASRSENGVDNLAPHSFFTVASTDPPIIQFTSVGEKDSLRNIRASGEFTVNFTPENLFERVNATGTAFEPEVSEFDAAGLQREASTLISTPRVYESPVALECRLHSLIAVGNCTLILGEVVHAAVSEQVLDGDHPRVDLLEPLSRLGRDEWGTLGEVRRIRRIRLEDWPGSFSAGGQ